MKLELTAVLLAICTYSTATHLHRSIKDVHHFIEEKVEAAKSVFPLPPPLPKIPPFIVKDHVHHELTDHYPQDKKFLLPSLVFPPPLFPKIHQEGPHILPLDSIVPHVLKPLLELPLPQPTFLKHLPIPIPIPVPIEHSIAPVVGPIIPITKDHHDIHLQERIR